MNKTRTYQAATVKGFSVSTTHRNGLRLDGPIRASRALQSHSVFNHEIGRFPRRPDRQDHAQGEISRQSFGIEWPDVIVSQDKPARSSLRNSKCYSRHGDLPCEKNAIYACLFQIIFEYIE
jgi:hypothetical protein